jgi:hypothetical protein
MMRAWALASLSIPRKEVGAQVKDIYSERITTPIPLPPYPAFSLVSTAFSRLWLAARRSGVRIPLGPQ